MKEKLYQTLDDLISDLNLRELDIFKKRLNLENKKYTLASLGQKYNLTRERIRQIQNNILNKIKNKAYDHSFLKYEFFENINSNLGKLKIKRLTYLKLKFKEDYHLDTQSLQIFDLFLRIHPEIYLFEENDIYNDFIYLKQEYLKTLNLFTNHLLKFFSGDKIISENEFLEFLRKEIFSHFGVDLYIDEIYEFIKIFKIIKKNPFGEFGYIENRRIVPSSLVDKIKLILMFEGKPLSFYQIYERLNEINKIEEEFIHLNWRKKYSLKTLHYILNFYKDIFVLVGRGIYALKDLGFKEGTIVDIMREIVRKNNGLTINKLLEELKKQRIFSENTFTLYLYKNFKIINNKVYLK
ncbi:MAG: hypothetical protein KatS3mg095_0289 [Candidatus Parcubacteria bacterium]|nr:MAG: hypothetical protein KatS3mg095_0289 [Candidatus Parcubacteria bacterium]